MPAVHSTRYTTVQEDEYASSVSSTRVHRASAMPPSNSCIKRSNTPRYIHRGIGLTTPHLTLGAIVVTVVVVVVVVVTVMVVLVSVVDVWVVLVVLVRVHNVHVVVVVVAVLVVTVFAGAVVFIVAAMQSCMHVYNQHELVGRRRSNTRRQLLCVV